MAKASRYSDRRRYFNELAATSREFYVGYLGGFVRIGEGARVLEVGCGEGGNLLPLAQAGCQVTGLDLAPGKIANAQAFFAEEGYGGNFFCDDFLACTNLAPGSFDLIIVHDVIEHIEPEGKPLFLARVRELLQDGGIAFFAFPAWRMPFGGHQQICCSRIARLPWIHLLPLRCYRVLLTRCGENPAQVSELLSIRRSRMDIAPFERLCQDCGLHRLERRLWLINPHYKAKYGLRPLRLRLLARVPLLREFLATSCFYVLGREILPLRYAQGQMTAEATNAILSGRRPEGPHHDNGRKTS